MAPMDPDVCRPTRSLVCRSRVTGGRSIGTGGPPGECPLRRGSLWAHWPHGDSRRGHRPLHRCPRGRRRPPLADPTGPCPAARAAADDQGLAISFAVMDAGGHLLAFVRMDGAPWVSADVAQGKAWTAAAYGVPSDAQKEKMAPMPNFAQAITSMTHGRFTPQTGAVPVFRDGTLLGALGASGGTGDQDEAVCSEAVTGSGFAIAG